MGISCTIKDIMGGGGGRLCEVAYTNPLLRPSMGAWALLPLAMPVTVWCSQDLSTRAKARKRTTERGKGVGGGFPLPMVGRFFLKIRV